MSGASRGSEGIIIIKGGGKEHGRVRWDCEGILGKAPPQDMAGL